jgi:hypothetical protein
LFNQSFEHLAQHIAFQLCDSDASFQLSACESAPRRVAATCLPARVGDAALTGLRTRTVDRPSAPPNRAMAAYVSPL